MGEELQLKCEPSNLKDRFAVAACLDRNWWKGSCYSCSQLLFVFNKTVMLSLQSLLVLGLTMELESGLCIYIYQCKVSPVQVTAGKVLHH